jgi:vesicle coat complex subunit
MHTSSRYNVTRILVVLVIALLTQSCFVRRIPPIRYIPHLGSKGDVSMEGILRDALHDKDSRVRRDAVKVLGSMTRTPNEQKRAAKSLGEALRDEDPMLRLEAVIALGNFTAKISGPHLKKALKDENVMVRMEVVRVLRAIYESSSTQVQQVQQP